METANFNIDKLVASLETMEKDYVAAIGAAYSKGCLIDSATLGMVTQLLKNIKTAVISAIELPNNDTIANDSSPASDNNTTATPELPSDLPSDSSVSDTSTPQAEVKANDNTEPTIKANSELPGASE